VFPLSAIGRDAAQPFVLDTAEDLLGVPKGRIVSDFSEVRRKTGRHLLRNPNESRFGLSTRCTWQS